MAQPRAQGLHVPVGGVADELGDQVGLDGLAQEEPSQDGPAQRAARVEQLAVAVRVTPQPKRGVPE